MDALVPALVVVACLAVVVVIAVLIVVGVRREKERQRRIRDWARGHGWTVTTRPTVDWSAQLPGRLGKVTTLVSNVISGRPVAVGEYSYTSESSNSDGSTSRTTHYYLVSAVRLDAAYPPVAVHARGALSRLGRTLWGDNPAASGDETFDRQFQILTKDPDLARSLIGPALIAEHVAGRVPEWSLTGSDLLTWQPGHIDDPTRIPMLVSPLLRVAQLLGR